MLTFLGLLLLAVAASLLLWLRVATNEDTADRLADMVNDDTRTLGQTLCILFLLPGVVVFVLYFVALRECSLAEAWDTIKVAFLTAFRPQDL